jgi:hypothetical protein
MDTAQRAEADRLKSAASLAAVIADDLRRELRRPVTA